jgi:hypothetical protein
LDFRKPSTLLAVVLITVCLPPLAAIGVATGLFHRLWFVAVYVALVLLGIAAAVFAARRARPLTLTLGGCSEGEHVAFSSGWHRTCLVVAENRASEPIEDCEAIVVGFWERGGFFNWERSGRIDPDYQHPSKLRRCKWRDGIDGIRTLHHEVPEAFDLCSAVKGDPRAYVAASHWPPHEHGVPIDPGAYFVHVHVRGKNGPSANGYYVIKFNGNWHSLDVKKRWRRPLRHRS